MNNELRSQYVHRLEEHIRQYLLKLEALLGPRDPRFVLGTARKSFNKNDTPHTSFPHGYHLNGNCIVHVHISKKPWEKLSTGQGVWQLAHECVHLLDPVILGNANILEEGLASWFQNEPKFHNEAVRRYIVRNNEYVRSYDEARKLVLACKPESHLCPAIKEIRASHVRIRDIEEEMHRSRLPGVSDSIIERLCMPFTLA